MKKLIILDHNGEVVYSQDLYLEGPDVSWTEETPKCVWVKEVYIVDLDKLPEILAASKTEVASQPELEFMPEPKIRLTYPDMEEIKVEPEPEPEEDVEEEIERRDREFRQKYPEEADKYEPETAINQSAGDEGSGETKQLASPEAASKKPAKRKPTKRSK